MRPDGYLAYAQVGSVDAASVVTALRTTFT